MIPLGEDLTVDLLLQKLDSTFSDLSPKNVTMQEFFAAQKPEESVIEYSCRLESLLYSAMDGSSMNPSVRNDMLRHRFWTGLSSPILRDKTRTDYESCTDYAQLLRRVRIKEKELGVSNPSSISSKKAQHNPLTSRTDTSSIDFKLKELESRLDSKFSSQLSAMQSQLNGIDSKFDQIMKKLGSASSTQQ